MTREEAIKMAKADLECMERDVSGQDEMCNSHKCYECSLNYEKGNMGEQKEWLRMAIKALEQEPCEDAISRKALISHIENQSREWGEDYDVQQILGDIEDMPSVKPQEPKTGHWIDEGFYADGHSKHAYRCSECDEHYIGYVGEYKRCPNCRVKMGVEQNG